MTVTTPAWSVIVPTYNRPDQLARCVDALTRLSPPDGLFEVVVVNDGGEVDPAIVERARAGEGVVAIRLVNAAHGGPAAARNAGARTAAGTWLAFTDDDCEPWPSWLQAFERALLERPDALAGGSVRNGVSGSTFSEASQLLAGFVAEWFDGSARERFFTSNNVAVERSAFLDAGGFDTAFPTSAGEDREFCDRWTAQGRPSMYTPDAIVNHMHGLSLRSFLRQHHGYGRAAYQFRRGRRAMGRPARVDLRFYVASVRHAFRSRPVVRGIALAGCTLLAHTAYATGLAREAWPVHRATHARSEPS